MPIGNPADIIKSSDHTANTVFLADTLSAQLSTRRQASRLRTLNHPPRPPPTLSSHTSLSSRHTSRLIDFSSNDFLSLSSSSALRTAFLDETTRVTSTHGLSSTGSRLLDGDSAYAHALEGSIAAFHNECNAALSNGNSEKDIIDIGNGNDSHSSNASTAGLLFNSGYDANVALFTCVPQPGDAIVYDDAIHASVHAGMRGSRVASGLRRGFRHNDMGDLERVLREVVAATQNQSQSRTDRDDRKDDISNDKREKNNSRNVFVAVEAVYSMDGDVADLRAIVDTVERLIPRGNGYVIVDEAHATGVIGPRGRGLVSELQLEDRVFARLHTFGKALACTGAILICPPIVKQYLINYARPLIYSTFMTYPSLAAIKTSYDFLMEGKTEPLVSQLNFMTKALFKRLQNLAATHNLLTIDTPLMRCPDQCPNSPIFSIQTKHVRSLAKYCQDGGFMVRAIVPPTVRKGTERIRICLHAENRIKEIDDLVDRIDQWIRAFQLIDQDRRNSNADDGLKARL